MSTRFAQALAVIASKAGDAAAATFNKMWALRDASTDWLTLSCAAGAEHREFDPRTFRRHIGRLREIGVVIVHRNHDPATGYRTANSYELLLVSDPMRILVVAASMAGRGLRAIARAARRAGLLEQYRTPKGHFGPRSISQDLIEALKQSVVVSDNLLQSRMVGKGPVIDA